MEDVQPLINRVEQSGLVTLDLAELLPNEPIVVFDLKDHLVQGLVLMEKPFREALKQTDWSSYADKTVTVTCTADALIPLWAYMLVATYLQPFAKKVLQGNAAQAEEQLLVERINGLDAQKYNQARIVIKGCGDKAIPPSAFVAITSKLRPVVASLMYGEPCSTVPVYKKALTKS